MTTQYLQIRPGSSLPDISVPSPFRSIVVIDENSEPEWRWLVCAWLVKVGCLYMMAWGKECERWHDSVDFAGIEEFDYHDVPDDKLVMTTSHEDEPLSDVFWFAKNCALHPAVELPDTLILHVSNNNKEKELLSSYNSA